MSNVELMKVFWIIWIVAMTALSFLEWAAGLRFWRFLMGVFGMLLGVVVGMAMGAILFGVSEPRAGPDQYVLPVCVGMLIGGISGAALFASALGFATFVFAWSQFASFALIPFQARMVYAIQYHAFDQVLDMVGIAGFVGLIAAVVVLATRPHSIIIISSLSGAGWLTTVLIVLVFWPQPNQPANLSTEAETLQWMLIFILTGIGIAIQYLATGKAELQKHAATASAANPPREIIRENTAPLAEEKRQYESELDDWHRRMPQSSESRDEHVGPQMQKDDAAGRLKRLTSLRDQGLISKEEYAAQRKRVLAELF